MEFVRGPQKSRIIGLMSGTSVDSIDAALCEIEDAPDGRITAKLLHFTEHAIPDELRARIFRLFENGTGSLSLACSLNFEIGEAFAKAVEELLRESGIPRETITALASHGQTAYHIPPHMAAQQGSAYSASTLQICEASVIAERTGLPVVADFRVADMAAGGNGAPLVPFADFHLFSRPGAAVVVHNIGGIANSTILSASGKLEDVTAFDTGPGNMIIDALVQHFYPDEPFDRDGHHAARGKVISQLLDTWMAMPYIKAQPPKTTGRELFGVQFAQRAIHQDPKCSGDDLIATATAFTARSLAVNLADHVFPREPMSEVLIAGGGARNPVLVKAIAEEIAVVCPNNAPAVRLLDETGFPSKARECIAFAVLGHARLRGIPGNVPSATGANYPALLGKIVEPSRRQTNS